MDEGKSNWMRFINCARFEEEQNLIAEQYDKLLFYKTYKKVVPGQVRVLPLTLDIIVVNIGM